MKRPVVITLVALSLIVASCAGSSSHASPTAPTSDTPSTSSSTTTTTTPATTTTGPRCGASVPKPAPSTRPMTLRRRPDGTHRLEVLVVGDSIAETTLPSMALGFDTYAYPRHFATRVDSIAFPGFGLLTARPSIIEGKHEAGFAAFTNWPKIFDDAIAKYDPDVVVALWGSWDIVPRLIDGRYLQPSDCAWTPFYRALLEKAWAHLTARGARIEWLAFPCTVRPENNMHYILNAQFRALADAHPDSVAYADLDGFACPQGKVVHSMRAPNGHVYALRGGDDTHFDFYGATFVLAPWVAAAATRYIAVP